MNNYDDAVEHFVNNLIGLIDSERVLCQRNATRAFDLAMIKRWIDDNTPQKLRTQSSDPRDIFLVYSDTRDGAYRRVSFTKNMSETFVVISYDGLITRVAKIYEYGGETTTEELGALPLDCTKFYLNYIDGGQTVCEANEAKSAQSVVV